MDRCPLPARPDRRMPPFFPPHQATYRIASPHALFARPAMHGPGDTPKEGQPSNTAQTESPSAILPRIACLPSIHIHNDSHPANPAANDKGGEKIRFQTVLDSCSDLDQMRKLLSFFPPPLFVPIFTQTRFKQINKQTHRVSKRTNQSINIKTIIIPHKQRTEKHRGE